MKLTRRDVVLGSTLAVVCARPAWAAWPERRIVLVHGFAPGGNADLIARIIGDRLTARLGQSVVVEGRPGAGGTLAAQQVARAEPDGYTLMIVVAGQAVYPSLYKKLAFDPVGDFTFVSMLSEYPFLVGTYPDHPVTTPADLIARAHASPTPLTYGTAGIGTGQHLSMELFASRASITLQHVPYRGNTNGTSDLLAKRIDFMVEAPASLLPLIQNGSLRAVGCTGGRRFFALPDVQTLAEGGVPGYAASSWSGLGAPANLPADIVGRLNREVHAILADPAVAESIRTIGNDVAPTTPEQFRARVVGDVAKWAEAAKIAKIEQI